MLLLLLLACASLESAPPPKQAPPRDLESVLCTTDTDCPRLACGPCNSGDAVTQRHVLVECYRNPCPEALSVCQQGACVVK